MLFGIEWSIPVLLYLGEAFRELVRMQSLAHPPLWSMWTAGGPLPDIPGSQKKLVSAHVVGVAATGWATASSRPCRMKVLPSNGRVYPSLLPRPIRYARTNRFGPEAIIFITSAPSRSISTFGNLEN